MFRNTALAAAFVLTSGCAAAPHKDGEVKAQAAPAAPAAQAPVAPVATPPAPPVRPVEELEPDVLFSLLVAEIAGQRGDYALTVGEYVHAAELSEDPDVAERATRVALFARDEKAAYKAVRRWVELAPDDQEARRILTLLALRAGDTKTALDNLEALVNMPQDQSRQTLDLTVAVLGNAKDRKAALQVLDTLAKRHPDNALVQYSRGVVALYAEQSQLALDSAEAALKLRPDWQEAKLLKARAQLALGQTEVALKALKAMVDQTPTALPLRMVYGRALLSARRYDEALAQFAELTKQAPQNADVTYAYGLLLLDAGRLDEAESTFHSLLELDKHVQDAYYYLGRLEELRKHPQKALDFYQQVTAPSRALDAQLRIARLLAQTGKLGEGRALLESLRARNPTIAPQLYEAEATLLRDYGEPQAAFDVYTKALKRFPGNRDLLYGRALTAEKLGRVDLLEHDLRQVLAKNPDDAPALNALGYTLADLTTRYAEALKYISKALELQPGDPAILDSMGWVQYRLGHNAKALEYLKQAFDALKDPEIAAHYGEVLWVSGDHGQARKVWAEGRKLEPDNAVLKRVTDRFLKP